MDRKKKTAASSSRTSEQPLRVTDPSRHPNPATPQSSGQPSYGKLNIGKPQSGTSERKTTFFGARASAVGLNRKSSIGGRNSMFGALATADKMKDPRPLHDKSYVQQCIRKLCEFLSENGYGEVSTKTFQSPSAKEFLKVFEFLFQQLDPTFELPKSKVEEEVPRLLRDLGYTIPLSKSSMYSIGAPHTWPHLLGALIWMIDTVKISRGLESEDMCEEFSDEAGESVAHSKLCIDMVADTYTKFMQGADSFEEEDRLFLSELGKAYSVDAAQLMSMQQKATSLTERVDQLEQDKHLDPLMNLRIEKEKLQTELQGLDTYVSELKTFRTSLEREEPRLAEELQAIGHHLDSLTQEGARLQHLLDNQKYTPADVERLNREKMELQKEISMLGKIQEEAEQHGWQEEMALAKIKEQVVLRVAEYHKMARKLKLYPASAENACGHDFEIQAASLDQHGSTAKYKLQIQLPLKKMITGVEVESEHMANKKLSLQATNEELKDQILHKTKELKLLRENNSKLDHQLEHDMQEMEREEQKLAEEKEAIEEHQKNVEKTVTSGHDEAVQKLKATKQQYQLVLHETTEERRVVHTNLTSVFSTAAEHLQLVTDFMEDQKKKMHVVSESMVEHHQECEVIRNMVDCFKEKVAALCTQWDKAVASCQFSGKK